MEALTEAWVTSFQVSDDPNNTAAPHPRFCQYKMKTSHADQETRRKSILKSQKENRQNLLEHVRKLTSTTEADSEEKMETQSYRKNNQRRSYSKRCYKNQLMFSEWMLERPDNLENDWVMRVCPEGKRCLLIASQGQTVLYSKHGFVVKQFPSFLPGGSRENVFWKVYTIMDCVFDEVSKTVYVLDMMGWHTVPMYDTEAEFRLSWVCQKLMEVPETMECSRKNPYKFVPLAVYPCTVDAMTDAVNKANVPIDGLLFYHKKAHYTLGATPLVVWLKPYMLPEVLGVQVSKDLMAKMPINYTNHSSHVEATKRRQAEKKQSSQKSRQNEDMDISSNSDQTLDQRNFNNYNINPNHIDHSSSSAQNCQEEFEKQKYPEEMMEGATAQAE